MPSHQHHPRGRQRPAEGTCAEFRRRRLLETANFSTIEEISEAENINPSYISRVLRMALLAPEIVETILAGRRPEGLTMARALQPFPVEWCRQRIQISSG